MIFSRAAIPRSRKRLTSSSKDKHYGVVYHALNRANGRLRIFDDDGDYAALEEVPGQAVERFGTRLLAWCLMPNHFHLLLWPGRDGELSHFMRWLTLTHT